MIDLKEDWAGLNGAKREDNVGQKLNCKLDALLGLCDGYDMVGNGV